MRGKPCGVVGDCEVSDEREEKGMKKLLVLLMVLLLTLALVGCENDGNYWQSEDYYTQEEVDELIQNAIDELGEELEDELPLQYYSKNEVDQLIQNAINNDKNYTQEEVYDIINTLLIDMVDFKYDDMVDISYDEETKTFTITQYNQYNEVFSVDTYTIDEIMDELGYDDNEDLLTETFYEDGVHMTVEYAIVDGKATYMTVCELYDDECETNYPKVTEKTYLTSDRETIVAELKNYIEMMEALYNELT